MIIFVCGQRLFGAAAFRLCRQLGHDVAGVSSPPENSRRDGPDKLARVARQFGVPWRPAGTLNADTLPSGVELIVAAHSHDFIGRATRRRARWGAVGYHPSLLPRHRGRDAVRWAIRMGEPVTGGTVYWLNETMDGGPIAAQDWCWIHPGDNAERLWRRELFSMGLRLLEQVLRNVPAAFAAKRPQDDALATFEPAIDVPRRFRPDLPMLPGPAVEPVPDAGYAWRVPDTPGSDQ